MRRGDMEQIQEDDAEFASARGVALAMALIAAIVLGLVIGYLIWGA